jgi:hypothetical protein
VVPSSVAEDVNSASLKLDACGLVKVSVPPAIEPDAATEEVNGVSTIR